MPEEDDSLFVSEEDVRRHEEQQQEDVNMGNTGATEPLPKPQAPFFPGDEEDPVVQSFPVYFANTLADKLNLFQYPTRSMTYPLVESLGTGILSSRVKSKSGMVEVDVPIDTGRFYDQDKSERWKKVDRQVMGGVLKDPKMNDDGSAGSNYMVGVFKNEELHVTPIKAIAQLRPQFKYVDQEALTEREIIKNVNTQSTAINGKKETRAVQMSAKASGDSAPRYSGALATRKQADEEQFVEVQWFDRDCDESWREGDKLVAVERGELKSSTTIDDFITELQK